LHVSLCVGGRILDVVAAHPEKPMTPLTWRQRDVWFDSVARHIAQSAQPVLVMGDFNATVFDDGLRRFMLTAALDGPEPSASFPARLGPLGIAIDHILGGHGLVVEIVRTGPDVGSDHRPLLGIVRFAESDSSPGADISTAQACESESIRVGQAITGQ
jgi:endonuclease/exonuclease/phosphatase (EEP) superfamily protein YafD